MNYTFDIAFGVTYKPVKSKFGQVKSWGSFSPGKISRILSKHLDLQLQNNMYFAGHDFETGFQGISVIIGGF